MQTGHFWGLVGLQAKAKNFSFEAKAKDFKMCSRGRRRALHFWIIAILFKIKLIVFLPKSQKNLNYFCQSHSAIEWDVFKENHLDHRWYNHFDVFLPNFGNDTLFHWIMRKFFRFCQKSKKNDLGIFLLGWRYASAVARANKVRWH